MLLGVLALIPGFTGPLLTRRAAAVTQRTAAIRAEAPPSRSSWPAMDDGESARLLEADADALFEMLDANSDGALSETEVRDVMLAERYEETLIEKVFNSIDADSNGSISKDEFRGAYLRHPTLRTAPGLGASVKQKLSGDADTIFDVLDANGDGEVSQSEMRAFLKGIDEAVILKIFATIDADTSGGVSRGEFRKAYLMYPSLRERGKGYP